jgi:hypothetical protein
MTTQRPPFLVPMSEPTSSVRVRQLFMRRMAARLIRLSECWMNRSYPRARRRDVFVYYSDRVARQADGERVLVTVG